MAQKYQRHLILICACAEPDVCEHSADIVVCPGKMAARQHDRSYSKIAKFKEEMDPILQMQGVQGIHLIYRHTRDTGCLVHRYTRMQVIHHIYDTEGVHAVSIITFIDNRGRRKKLSYFKHLTNSEHTSSFTLINILIKLVETGPDKESTKGSCMVPRRSSSTPHM